MEPSVAMNGVPIMDHHQSNNIGNHSNHQQLCYTAVAADATGGKTPPSTNRDDVLVDRHSFTSPAVSSALKTADGESYSSLSAKMAINAASAESPAISEESWLNFL